MKRLQGVDIGILCLAAFLSGGGLYCVLWPQEGLLIYNSVPHRGIGSLGVFLTKTQVRILGGLGMVMGVGLVFLAFYRPRTWGGDSLDDGDSSGGDDPNPVGGFGPDSRPIPMERTQPTKKEQQYEKVQVQRENLDFVVRGSPAYERFMGRWLYYSSPSDSTPTSLATSVDPSPTDGNAAGGGAAYGQGADPGSGRGNRSRPSVSESYGTPIGRNIHLSDPTWGYSGSVFSGSRREAGESRVVVGKEGAGVIRGDRSAES